MFNRSALHFAIEGGDGTTMDDFQKIEKLLLNLDTNKELINDTDYLSRSPLFYAFLKIKKEGDAVSPYIVDPTETVSSVLCMGSNIEVKDT